MPTLPVEHSRFDAHSMHSAKSSASLRDHKSNTPSERPAPLESTLMTT